MNTTTSTVQVGQDVIAQVWAPGDTDTFTGEVMGVAVRVERGTVWVRVIGFPEAPYQVGDVYPLNADRVSPVPDATPVGWQHRDGLVVIR